MKIVFISDTHREENKVKIPECDILIHAGDFDIRDLEDLERLNGWFYNQPAKRIVWIGGNHDFYLEKISKESIQVIVNSAIYLENSSVIIEGLKIWGTPYSVQYENWAYMLNDNALREIWKMIPDDTDIVISHSPPHGILDLTDGGCNAGSLSLLNRIKEIKPKLHVFAHIHEGYGKYTDYVTDFINASQMSSTYDLENKPIILEI